MYEFNINLIYIYICWGILSNLCFLESILIKLILCKLGSFKIIF